MNIRELDKRNNFSSCLGQQVAVLPGPERRLSGSKRRGDKTRKEGNRAPTRVRRNSVPMGEAPSQAWYPLEEKRD